MNLLRHSRGFTLVELLVVVVIIGVMALVIGPTFTTGSDVARIKTASRGLMQLSRYARNMALLHQVPVDLAFTSDGTLSVSQAGGGGETIVSAKAFAVTNAAAAAEAQLEDEVAPALAGGAEGQGGGSAYVMADLNIEKKFEQTAFFFEAYTDTMDDKRSGRDAKADSEESAGGDEVQTFRVRYKSNGTCRPYRVRVTAAGDESFALTVVVDVLGAAKIEEEDE